MCEVLNMSKWFLHSAQTLVIEVLGSDSRLATSELFLPNKPYLYQGIVRQRARCNVYPQISVPPQFPKSQPTFNLFWIYGRTRSSKDFNNHIPSAVYDQRLEELVSENLKLRLHRQSMLTASTGSPGCRRKHFQYPKQRSDHYY